MLVDVSYPKWRILFCNGQFDLTTGLSGSEITGQHVWDHFTVCGKNEVHLAPSFAQPAKDTQCFCSNSVHSIACKSNAANSPPPPPPQSPAPSPIPHPLMFFIFVGSLQLRTVYQQHLDSALSTADMPPLCKAGRLVC